MYSLFYAAELGEPVLRHGRDESYSLSSTGIFSMGSHRQIEFALQLIFQGHNYQKMSP